MSAVRAVPEIVIIGAGPAGLTAAYELARNKTPATVLEADNLVGGLSPKFLDHGQLKLPLTRAGSETDSFLLSTTATCGNWRHGR